MPLSTNLTPATFLLGDNAVQARQDALGAERAEAFRFRAQATGTVGGAQIYLSSANDADLVVVGLYSNANNQPGTLLSVGSLVPPTAGAWNSVALTTSPVAAGSTYWLAILGEGGRLGFSDSRWNSCPSETSAQGNLNMMPTTWSSGRAQRDCPLAGYVTTSATVLTPPVGTPPVETPPKETAPTEKLPPEKPSKKKPPVEKLPVETPPVETPPVETPPVETPPAPPAAPSNTALPQISGTATEGDKLTATNGTWEGDPTGYAYQWRDCNTSGASCTNINGANATSYTLTSSDVGHTVRVVVSATNEGGKTPATSNATATVAAIPPAPPAAPTNTALPQISGTPTEGDVLTASKGTWEGNPTGYAYQWQDCNTTGASCTNINGANATGYTLTSSDVGDTIRVVVSATNEGGKTPATSNATATVAAIPPPAAPTNTAMPAISGPTTEGETLKTTNGAWTGSPTSYAYQWRRCSTSGRSCANVSGATNASYTLSAGDVSHTMRVTVTAANEGGAASMSSPATSTVSAPAPTAPTDTALPTISGTATEGQTLSASTGSWEESPTSYAYQWQDCNTSGTGCTNISGATSSSHKLTATDVGETIRVVVTATNEGGSTSATSAATAAVAAAAPPPPPAAPTNTTPPTISGTATEGQTLNASTGSWSGSPTSYAYQWQDCNTTGASCTNISGATAAAHVLSASDVGDTLRVLVKASNTGGSGESTSAATSVIAAKQSGSGGTPESCFSSPESCGYPGPNNVGVANCSALKASGGKTITKAETIEGLDITGEVVVAASGVKLNNDCIEVNGNEEEGSAAVILNNGASNFTISNSTIRGKNTTSQSIEEALRNNYSNAGATAIKDRLENCAECLHQTWTINESYVIANGEEKADESGQSHAEDWWFDNGTISANDDTLLNPSKQTAVIFAESGGGSCENHETVTNSLLAGGGFMFYFCAHSSGAGSSSIDIKNNRFARDICTKKEVSNYEGRGGYGCGPEGAYFSYGEGSGGYFPRGGFFGLVYEGEGVYNKGAGWEGNYWDNNLASVEAP